MGRRSQRGQATVELALVLPVAVLMALSVAQVAVIAVDSVLVHHAAREGARAAAVEPTVAVATEAAYGAAGLEASRLDISLAGGRSRGEHLTVTARYTAPTKVPLIGRMLGDIDLRASVTIRVE